jgi:hypothetical protein
MMIANKDLITHAPKYDFTGDPSHMTVQGNTAQGNPAFTTDTTGGTGQVWTGTIDPSYGVWQSLCPNRTFDANPYIIGINCLIILVLIICLCAKQARANKQGYDAAGELWRTEAAKRGHVIYDNINDKMIWQKDKTDIPSHSEVGSDE